MDRTKANSVVAGDVSANCNTLSATIDGIALSGSGRVP
jgi:hypothetical protein